MNEDHPRYVRIRIPGCPKAQTDANIRRFLAHVEALNRQTNLNRYQWPPIGLLDHPVVGECGLIEPPSRRPWRSYVVLPHAAGAQ